jgi:hypothetical protein
MGYTTEFSGSFTLNKELSKKHYDYLKKFSSTRRMLRDSHLASLLPDPERLAVGITVSNEGEYFVGGSGFMGQGHDESVIDCNKFPSTQPGFWCQWTPSLDRKSIEWDGNENFYYYDKWIIYIIDNFLKPWGYTLDGTVYWSGEEVEDNGRIVVKNNIVIVQRPTYA